VALVGRALGHPVHIVTDPRIDPVTLAKLRALGCVLHVVPAMTGAGWQSARLERLHQLRRELGASYWPRQYSNPQNPLAYHALAAELVADLDGVDLLVGAVGSGGSLCGTAKALRQRHPGLRVIGVDCVGSVLFGQPDRPQRLQSGLGNSLVPPNLNHGLVDEVHWLNDREAFAAAVALATEQQLFGGNTAGSVYQLLRYLADREPPGTTIVGILPDRGDRYVDTVFADSYWQDKRIDELPLSTEPAWVEYGTPVSRWSYSNPNVGAACRA
jgi:cysteine synthase A